MQNRTQKQQVGNRWETRFLLKAETPSGVSAGWRLRSDDGSQTKQSIKGERYEQASYVPS